jgi:Membrane-fusion protein
VQADRANVADLATQLDFTHIRAPIDGRLGTIALKLGASVPANGTTPLVTINQMQPIDVSLPLAQRQLPALQAAMAHGPVAASVSLPDGAGTIDGGHLAYIDNQVDAATSTIAVYARFPNHDERLWPGEYVEASLVLGIEPKALVVPGSAVQTGQDGNYVFRLDSDQRVHLVPVTVRRSEGDLDVIAGKLSPGDQVVTSGQLRLRDGGRVAIRKAAASGTDAP